jgi:hypothetical protein
MEVVVGKGVEVELGIDVSVIGVCVATAGVQATINSPREKKKAKKRFIKLNSVGPAVQLPDQLG